MNSTYTIRESALIRCYICVQKKGKLVQVLLAEMVLAVNSTGTIEISTSSMKRVVLVLSIENSVIVTKIVIKQWLIMTYPLTGRVVAVVVAVTTAAVAMAAVVAAMVGMVQANVGHKVTPLTSS